MKPTLSCYRWIILGAAMIAAVALIVYQPGLRIGFWTDDYSFLETAGRLNFVDYWISYLDPRLQWHWYRPMQGLYWWVGYAMFRGDPTGYHLMQLGLHIANAILLFGLTKRVARRWQLALVAALIYVALPAMSLAVFWVGVADPLVGFFYLLAIKFWLDYLASGRRAWFVFTLVAFMGALLSKEIGVMLPLTLFLADRWLIGKPLSPFNALRRYALFALLLPIYVGLEMNVLTHGVFTSQLGYRVGGHIPSTLIYHLTTLAFPWGMDAPLVYVWLLLVLALVGWAAFKREWRVVFLAAATILAVLPILPFPAGIATASRYLYLPLMGSAAGVALLVEFVNRLSDDSRRRWMAWGTAFAVALLIAWQGAVIAENSTNFEGTVRQSRLQFRPIFQTYASFAPDTFLYFINPPVESPYVSGMFFLRYGANVVVSGTDLGRVAGLRDYSTAIVFYQDGDKNWRRQVVDKNGGVTVVPKLPANFDKEISLDSFELAGSAVKRGEPIVLILYWRAVRQLDRDYTAFVHVIDRDGQTVAGYDAPLLRLALPTSQWRVGEPVADGVVIPIDSSVPPGEYRLEIGLYDLGTMQRLAIVDTNQSSDSDRVVLSAIAIRE